jgi:kumamolisin
MRKDAGIERRTPPQSPRGPTIWAGIAGILVLGLVAGSALARPPAPTPLASGTQARASTSTAESARLGSTDPARAIAISVSLAGRSPSALTRTLAGIYDPRSPDFHHFLTPTEFAARFGAPESARSRVEMALQAARLVILPSSSSTSVNARGTVGQVEGLFGVRLDDYRTGDGTTYFAPEASPQLPAALNGLATGVLGLDTRPAIHRAITPIAGRTSPHFLGPRELDRAYDFGPLHAAGLLGDTQTIAFAEIDTFTQADIDAYDQHFLQPVGLTAPPVQVVPVGSGAPPAKDGSEMTLDIEVVHAIAPHATLLAYEGTADPNGITRSSSRSSPTTALRW